MPSSGHETSVPFFSQEDIWGDGLIEFNSVASRYYRPWETQSVDCMPSIPWPWPWAQLQEHYQFRTPGDLFTHRTFPMAILALQNFHSKTEWLTWIFFDDADLYWITFQRTADWAPVLEALKWGRKTWNSLHYKQRRLHKSLCPTPGLETWKRAFPSQWDHWYA